MKMKNTQINNKNLKYIVSAAEMKRCDGNTITHFGVPQEVLMERAALSLCEVIRDKSEKGRAIVFAGAGNNGGDGIAAGRLLFQEGREVLIVTVNHSPGKISKACSKQLEIAKKYGVPVKDISEIEDGFRIDLYDVIIDAILGIGCSRDLSGEIERAVGLINLSADKDSDRQSVVFSADIPTGINADNGKICKVCVNADVTVTFGFMKLGLMLYPGRGCCGEVYVREVGITPDGFLSDLPKYRYITNTQGDCVLGGILPKRDPSGNKGTFGKVLVIAGSRDCSGAMLMASESALRSGAGMVKIFTEKTNLSCLQTVIPEAMSETYEEGSVLKEMERIGDALKRDAKWADVIVCGPGMGTGESGKLILKTLLKMGDKPIVLDADALNIIAADKEIRSSVKEYKGEKVMTPHLAEFGRLCDKSVLLCKEQILDLPAALAKEFHASIICKDARTIITDGEKFFINLTGNDGMATAGSGDVLAGLLGALMCTSFETVYAAAAACYLHGYAGDAAALKKGKRVMTARDISEELQKILILE